MFFQVFSSPTVFAPCLQCTQVWKSWKQGTKDFLFTPLVVSSCCLSAGFYVLLTQPPSSTLPPHFGTVHWAPNRPPGSTWAKLINASCRGHGSPPLTDHRKTLHTWARPSVHEAHTHGHAQLRSSWLMAVQTLHCLLVKWKSRGCECLPVDQMSSEGCVGNPEVHFTTHGF